MTFQQGATMLLAFAVLYKMTQLLLIRHGQASFGEENYDRLSDLGVSQSKAIGKYLVDARLQPTRVITGELERQKDTASHAMASAGLDVPVSRSLAFDEYDSSGVFANFMPSVLNQFPAIREQLSPDDYSLLRDRSIFKTLYFPVMHKWIDGEKPQVSRCESSVDFANRVVSGLDLLDQDSEEERVAVFTSGGVISVLMMKLLGMPPRSIAEFNWRTANASITRWIRTERGWGLESYNHVGHIIQHGLKVTHL